MRDENVKVVDLGYENFAVGVVHRGSTRTPAPPAPGGAGSGAAAQAAPCAHTMATLSSGRNAGRHHSRLPDRRLHHRLRRRNDVHRRLRRQRTPQRSEPSGRTKWADLRRGWRITKVTVKVGDVVIVPPGVVHGWADIPDHVDYLSFRPFQGVMRAGWVNPTVAK